MLLSTLIQKNSLLVRSEESVLSIKIILQSFINLLWLSLKKCWWKQFWLGVPSSAAFLCNFCSCFTWVGIYMLNTTNLTWKKVNQIFAITIKRVDYLISFLGHKTLKSVSLFYVATIFTSTIPTTKCTFFPNKWEIHFSSN